MTNIPEFNTNFKIPLKSETSDSSEVPTVVSPVDMGSWGSGFDSPVTPGHIPGVPGNGWWPHGTFIYPTPPPPPAPSVISAPPALNANGIKRKIDKVMMLELNDPSLPKELTAMFQPLFCKLCLMHLNSSSNAKLHYLSKNHQKRVKKFLIQYSEKTGEPLHKKAKIPVKNDIPDDPKYKYCSICDLQLTSKLHAEQHYMGKNHQKAANKRHKPAGNGYYDELGQWHRTDKLIDTTGRFGIGMAFAKPEEFQPITPLLSSQSKFYCDLCKVSTTSAEHLQMHMNGQKHQKLLKRSVPTEINTDPFEDLEAVPRKDLEIPVPIPTDNILNSIKSETSKTDYSVYRTPSGWYYCQLCNVTLNSEAQFVKHLESKKHLKKKNTSPTPK